MVHPSTLLYKILETFIRWSQCFASFFFIECIPIITSKNRAVYYDSFHYEYEIKRKKYFM